MRSLLTDIINWIRRFIGDKFNSQNENFVYYITILVAGFLFVVGLNAFVELTDELAENELNVFDTTIANYVVSFRSDSLTTFFKLITHLGDRIAYIILTILLAIFFFIRIHNWKFILQVSIVLILSSLTNLALKKVINRTRPSAEHLVAVNTLSYPSGHSMSAMAFYGFLVYLCFQVKINRAVRIILIVLLIFIILSIGLSRIYLGVHYPSDVAAGFMGGLIWVTLCIIIFNIIDLMRKRKAKQVE